jgi:hypothetical protein
MRREQIARSVGQPIPTVSSLIHNNRVSTKERGIFMPMNDPETWEESANEFIERQTREIEEEFGCSRPQPRNRVMGFRGSDKPKRQREFSNPSAQK